MTFNPTPPSELEHGEPRRGASHWLVIPVTLLAALIGVNVIGPLTVDFLVQDALALPEGSRQVPMLLIDLVLSTTILVAVFLWAGLWARSPQLRAQGAVAIVLLIITVWMRYDMGLYEPGVMPVVYEIGVIGTVLVGWFLARRRLLQRSRGMASSGVSDA